MKTSFYQLYHQRILENIENHILCGETISQSMKNEKIFKPLEIRIVSVGEATRRLEDQMKMLANFYYEKVKNLVDTLIKILEPVVLAIAGIIFLFIVIALIGPIYELISQLSQL